MSSPAPPYTSTGPSVTPVPALRLPELLAPAGDWECARAAVENGADAIYFGLDRFNARMRANNFTEPDLPALMAYLHRRGVKGYVTFNTLVFENELLEAEQYARTMIAAGVDAAIVQDIGICRMLRELSPDFPIHASTQMTITSAGGVEFARQLGCNLVVLARECSLKETEKILLGDVKDAPSAPATMPLEVFVHGALCVAYSGQCLTSEALGGRSANRGECAQACRMPYELLADGALVDLGDRKYLLSPQDLAGLEVLPELARIGVASLKIEGRLKSPEYVANITRIYREALQRLADEPPGASSPEPEQQFHLTPGLRADASARQATPLLGGEGGSALRPGRFMGRERVRMEQAASHEPDKAGDTYEMEMAFSRGLYTGWFGGINNQELVHGRFGKKRGVFLGTVLEVRRDGVLLPLEGPLKPGDGVVFDAGRPEEKEQGGRVYELHEDRHSNGNESDGKQTLVKFGHGDIDFGRVHVGDKLWKTSDPELDRRLRQSYAGEAPKFQRPIFFEIDGALGKPLRIVARDEFGHLAHRDSAMPLARAEKQPLSGARLREQLGRLGGTPFRLAEVVDRLERDLMLPVSELNRLRRELVSELESQRAQPPRWTLRPEPALAAIRSVARDATHSVSTAELIVLVRSLDQLDAVLLQGVNTIYCEFEDPKKYREAVAHFRAHHSNAVGMNKSIRPTIWVAPPRIFKMGEEWTLKQVRSSEADGYLVRNYDHLEYFKSDRRRGDYSLNVANHWSAQYFKHRYGLERLTASYDLNVDQLAALLKSVPPEWFEITIHQHMPMFHMEHCVFCAFLSSGTDYTNCGRPCDHREVKLRDRVGAEHPVKADAGCRNTVYHARAQTGAEYFSRFVELGVRHFRLEFLNESAGQVVQTVQKYRDLLDGQISGPQLWRELKLFNQLGVTRGQIGRPA